MRNCFNKNRRGGGVVVVIVVAAAVAVVDRSSLTLSEKYFLLSYNVVLRVDAIASTPVLPLSFVFASTFAVW